MNLSHRLILSSSDLWAAFKKNARLLLVLAVLGGAFSFYHALQKPLLYTVEADFKKGGSRSTTGAAKVLETLAGGTESSSSYEDPKYFLASYPVAKKVAEDLNLQGCIQEKVKQSRWRHCRDVLKAEWARHCYTKKIRPHSAILDVEAAITDRPVFPQPPLPLLCREIHYGSLLFDVLEIQFSEEDRFKVFQKKKPIGEGTCGVPFEYEKGTFTLDRNGQTLKNRQFVLTLIPLQAAARSLEKSIALAPVKKNPSLLHITYTHPNKNLAADLVNAFMKQFCTYLQTEGEKRIQKQLHYLDYRQNLALKSFESTLLTHKKHFESDIASGGFITLEKEIEYLAKQQAEALFQLHELAQEMQGYKQPITDKEISTQELVGRLRAKKTAGALFHDDFLGIDLTGAKKLLILNQEKLDACRLEKANCQACLKKLEEDSLDCKALETIFEHNTLDFTKLHTLTRNFLDVDNWSPKEREQLKAQIEAEKKFLNAHVKSMQESAEIQESVLLKKIPLLQLAILNYLLDAYESLEGHLCELAKKALQFPEKWMAEQKIELSKKMHAEIIESIMKSIEAKNIAYHMEYLNAKPVYKALPPSLPDPPRLVFSFFVGWGAGFLGGILFLFCKAALQGASASPTNLKWCGLKTAGLFTTFYPLTGVSHQHSSQFGQTVLSDAEENPEGRVNITLPRDALKADDETDDQSDRMVGEKSGLTLKNLKKRDSTTLRTFFAQSNPGAQCYLLGSQTRSSFPLLAAALLAKQGKKVLFCDIVKTTSHEETKVEHFLNDRFFLSTPKSQAEFSIISLELPPSTAEELFQTRRLKDCFEKWKKEYDAIILGAQEKIQSIFFHILMGCADQTGYIITNEKLEELLALPQILFIFGKTVKLKAAPSFSIKSIAPLIDSIRKRTSFSFLKGPVEKTAGKS